jgi:hypothetical protein
VSRNDRLKTTLATKIGANANTLASR